MTTPLKSLLALVSFALLLALPARSEPVTLSRTEAFELHAALTKLSPGLTPDNTFLAADAINALEPTANAFRTGYAKLVQIQQAATTPEAIAAFRASDEKFSAIADERRTYDLTVFALTKDEVKAAGITASQLAVIKRLLKKDEKPVGVESVRPIRETAFAANPK